MGLIGKIFNLTNLTLVTALTLSTIAAWYSILGLTAIFAAAVIPIIIMGGALEVSKVVTTVWLHKYWHQVKWSMKFYLVLAVIALAFLTSMGIFGFLSKAHSDQSLVSGDSQAKLALFDEKIKTERDNIEAARRALQQMDAQVDARLNRSDDERGAERAVQIRKTQAKERAILQADIAKFQKNISALNQERAPIASELRKVEAEVGPIKYIAALLYGDNPDQNVLERAVRWVIILIVIIFDPLAVVLLLASQYSFQYFRRVKEEQNAATDAITPHNNVHVGGPISTDEPVSEQQSLPTTHEKITHCPQCGTEVVTAAGIGDFCPNKECDVIDNLYGDIDPETQEFFKRIKLIAKLQDIEDEQADIEEANRLISEILQDDDEQSEEMASDVVELTQAQEDEPVEYYPFPIERPLEGDAKLKQDAINDIPVLENEETWASRVIDEDHDEPDDTESKRLWKLQNPQDTIKRQRALYDKGLIDHLPWDTVEKFDEENKTTYEEDDGPLTEQQLQQVRDSVEYVQNGEQNEKSIWQQIKQNQK